MKLKKRKTLRVVLIVLAVLVLAMGTMVLLVLPKPVPLENARPNLAALADGLYTGRCDNGLVAAAVEVELRGGVIVDIRLLEHQNGLGAPGEAVLPAVVETQCLEVDAVAGATASSNTLLKAVENALRSAPAPV